ncbi:hypothetical protein HPB49_020099 [Dermacentor silvarum]|uniref:Uncharacterized protein n=1 Tax=Dermacentor silvarum TaxID=543639 RepID=A0ACB8DKK0_DERSI|nr:hypothetical protein HPB49_020099 [Dermacentor silvarum]
MRPSPAKFEPSARWEAAFAGFERFEAVFESQGEPPTKRPAAMGKTIGTHSGNFHCDDALACFLLKQLPEYRDATVVRSRDQAVLDTCDAVVDVGAVYDHSKSRYDHHQKYRINTNLSSRVAHLNPPWNEPNPKLDEQFQKAMKLTGEEFLERVRFYATAWLPARELVLTALQQRQKDHLLALEEELSIPGEVKFVLYQDQGGSWRVQGVPVALGSFDCRVFLPEKWRGVRDEELSKVSGIDGCIFVHSSGFIGGHKTKEGALEMATRTLKATA